MGEQEKKDLMDEMQQTARQMRALSQKMAQSVARPHDVEMIKNADELLRASEMMCTWRKAIEANWPCGAAGGFW